MAKQKGDQQELKQKLLANEISWQEALTIITSSATPPWKSKEWKLKRDELLATNCKQCGTSEPPLVLQHTWQPKPLAQVFQDVRSNYLSELNTWRDKNSIEIDLSGVPPDIDACPKCFSPTIKFRKTLNNWKCVAQESGVFCHHIFETPVRRVSDATRKALSKAAWKKLLEEFDTAFDIGKRAVVLAIDQHARYLSMQDTTTLCKRCAFVADRTKMVLCQMCRANYHSPRHDRCSKCAGMEPSGFNQI